MRHYDGRIDFRNGTSYHLREKMIARGWYDRGKSFIGSSILLRRQCSHDYVSLHLLSQGIEIVLKALLLLEDYDTYKPKLKNFGHNLERLAVKASPVFKVKKRSSYETDELKALNNLYKQHLLRYGSMIDIFIDPATISYQAVMRKVTAVIRLAEKKLA